MYWLISKIKSLHKRHLLLLGFVIGTLITTAKAYYLVKYRTPDDSVLYLCLQRKDDPGQIACGKYLGRDSNFWFVEVNGQPTRMLDGPGVFKAYVSKVGK